MRVFGHKKETRHDPSEKMICVRVAAILLGIMLTMSFVGCTKTAPGVSEKPDTADESADIRDEESRIAVNEGDMITIGFSQVGAESDWRIASTASIEEAFSLQNGYHLIYEDAQQRQENQTKAIREFIDQGVDYIILDPIVETGWEASLEEAKAAGIPVIIVDRRIEVEDESLYTAWVGADFWLEGRRACQWLSDYLTEIEKAYEKEQAEGTDTYTDYDGPEAVKNDDEESETADDTAEEEDEDDSIDIPEDPFSRQIGIVDIQGTIGATAQIGRTGALLEAVEQHPEWTLLAADTGDYVQAKGREVAEAMLAEYGDQINVMYCENDNMAYGAIEAIKASGRNAGCDILNGDILVISFDATRQGLRETFDGSIAVNTECTPDYGPKLSQMIQTLENGGVLDKESYMKEEQFSAQHEVHLVRVDQTNYKVTFLTEEIMGERTY